MRMARLEILIEMDPPMIPYWRACCLVLTLLGLFVPHTKNGDGPMDRAWLWIADRLWGFGFNRWARIVKEKAL